MPYKDDQGGWRVGSKNKEFTPFTKDNRPAILLLRKSKYTELEMKEGHDKGHIRIKTTVIKFRMAGFWMVQAGKLAKKIKQGCLICRCLDQYLIMQQMRSREETKMKPSAWQVVEIDLMGLCSCKSDVNKHSA